MNKMNDEEISPKIFPNNIQIYKNGTAITGINIPETKVNNPKRNKDQEKCVRYNWYPKATQLIAHISKRNCCCFFLLSEKARVL